MDLIVIDIKGLCKSYGSERAVDALTFGIRRGEIFALLGPNGAGKTTTLEMLEGLTSPDSGDIRYFGRVSSAIDDEVKNRIGVQLQSSAFFPYLKVEEVLRMFSSLYPKKIPVGSLIERFSLEEKRRALTKNLSGGQSQRLALACALVNDPEILFLDEPTTGLDTQTRMNLWNSIRALRAEGRTVILTTHYMDEAEALADRVAIMDHGTVIALGRPQELIAAHGVKDLESLFLQLTGTSLRE